MTREEHISNLETIGCDDWTVTTDAYKSLQFAIKALKQDTIAQERYEDLCEYFGDAKDILNSRDDFKAWLDRVKWHIHKAEELYEKYEQEPKYCDRNICISNEYNGIGCDECEVTKSQELKTGHCKDCKWWKDSDGAYRRGIGAESQCPMNRIEVYEGNGYCFMFEPQEE